MSRSNNIELTNPATRFFEWNAQAGTLNYYDKDTKTNVMVDMPFRFLILDRVAQVTGGTKKQGKYDGYWSNAVKNVKTQKFVVRNKEGVIADGLWADIKDTRGLKFMTGLYVAFRDGQELKTGYLKLKGSSLTAWIEFTKNHRNLYAGAFSIVKASEPLEGVGDEYYQPIFSFNPQVTEETERDAKALDVELQKYFDLYFRQQGQAIEAEVIAQGDAYEAPYDNRADDDGYRSPNENDFANEPEDLDDSTPF